MIELKVPELGESIQEVQIGRWLKQEGEPVEQDEPILELETDKASMEIPAPASGILRRILKQDGEIVPVGEVIAQLDEQEVAAARDQPVKKDDRPNEEPAARAPAREPSVPVTPSARRALLEHGLSASEVRAQGKQLRREDVLRHVQDRQQPSAPGALEPQTAGELEEVVPMSLIRRRIAERLVQAQQQAALLTTFNEIDMSKVIALRQAYREAFQEKYGIKLGFMSFFVKAVVEALKEVPALNAQIRDQREVVYRNYYHVGIAVGGGKGLVVPVLRHADRLSFAQIEQAIDQLARRARENRLEPHHLEGGTFTITNGGIYGSLLSTPIVNPPQSGVLGMHAIQERPVARDGQVVIRPMMYVALTYDHRLIDGREAVTFLRRVKETVEDPPRMLIEI